MSHLLTIKSSEHKFPRPIIRGKPFAAKATGVTFSFLVTLGTAQAAAKTHTLPSIQQTLTAADQQAFAEFPKALAAMSAAHLATDHSGLIGRNREWGALYSPRFQLGSGQALRMAIAARQSSSASRAFRAIEAGTQVISPQGYVPSTLPPKLQRTVSAAEVASGAAFFLGDACMGMTALRAMEQADTVASAKRRHAVEHYLILAIRWLLTQQALLFSVDREAPNRLLFNARAFQACVALTTDRALRETGRKIADRFVSAALSLHTDDGHFIEGGGHDTSYQGVAIRIGEDVLLAGYLDSGDRLASALTSAAKWLVARVNADGSIDSSGNKRTCWSDEVFMGKPKLVSVTEIFSAFVYTGTRLTDASLWAAARRIEEWVDSHPDTNPCFR